MMKDIATINYRKQQLNKVVKVNAEESSFLPVIKIARNGRETNYLNITFAELEQIKDILIKG